MTCIIGLVENGTIYVGGDSAAVSEYDTHIIATPKVFKIGEMLVGYTDSFRMGQLIQYNLKLQPQNESVDDYTYMVTYFIDAVRSAFAEGGWVWEENKREFGGHFIVGYRKNIYHIQDNFSVMQYVTSFYSVGCGYAYAMSAMKVLDNLPPKKRIKKALATAQYFSSGVQKPFHILSMK